MTIYTVKPGDSVYSIAKANSVPPQRIIDANDLSSPYNLIVGQSLVIPQGQRVHRVAPGESLTSIAQQYGTSVAQIQALNPFVGATGNIVPGQLLIIPSAEDQKLGTIEVNGYIYPGSNQQIVTAALPSLTYLSIFSYEVTQDGSLNDIDDASWITLAKQYRVAPMMVITNVREGHGFNSDIAHSVLNNATAQTTLINNIVSVMQRKGYYGLNIDFEYIYPYDRASYNNFLRIITARLSALGYPVFTAVAPKNTASQRGLLYEAHDYPAHGEIVDRVILMTYEWGYLAGPPQAVAPLNLVRGVLDYAVSVIPSNKILMGIPNYGYDWTLPYQRGTLADTFSNVTAVDRAAKNNSDIKYDTTAQSPYYNYYDAQGRQHIVWFEDARSIQQKLLLVNEYKLAGVSYWTIDRPFAQNLIVLNSMYNVKKVL